MRSFFYQIGLFMCFALSFGQNVFAQSLNDVNENIVQVLDLIMLQKELNNAASNGEYDIIQIGEGVFDLSLMDQDLGYYPLPLPQVVKEEKYPIMIVGAGAGKTIFDQGDYWAIKLSPNLIRPGVKHLSWLYIPGVE